MKNMTMFEKNVPMPTSSLRSVISRRVAPTRSIVSLRPTRFSS